MTTFYSSAVKGVIDGTKPWTPGDAGLAGNRVHSIVSTLDLAANAVLIGDIIVWGEIPANAIPLVGTLFASVSLGSSTIDVGTDQTAAAFRAAGTFTAVDTPTLFMKTSAFLVPMTKRVRLQSVVAAANMPNSATNRLGLKFEYAAPFAA